MHAPQIGLAVICMAAWFGCAAPRANTPAPSSSASNDTHAAPELDYDQLLLAAQSYIDSGRGLDAASVAADAARLKPERPEAFVVWGRALAQSDQLEASAAHYEEARRLGSRDPELFAELASVYDVSKRYTEAVAVYRDYLRDHPADAVMRDELGLTLLLLDQPQDAVSAMLLAVQVQPNNPQLHQDLGYAYLRANHPKEAVASLETVLQREPQRTEASRYLAQAYAALGDSGKAVQILNHLLQAAPRDRAARLARARLHSLGGASQSALEDYQVLLKDNAEDAPCWLGAAGCLIALKRLDEADKAVAHARATLGEHPQVQFRQAQIDWRRGHLQAIEVLERLAAQSPNPDEAWQEVRLAALETKNHELERRASKHLGSEPKATR